MYQEVMNGGNGGSGSNETVLLLDRDVSSATTLTLSENYERFKFIQFLFRVKTTAEYRYAVVTVGTEFLKQIQGSSLTNAIVLAVFGSTTYNASINLTMKSSNSVLISAPALTGYGNAHLTIYGIN